MRPLGEVLSELRREWRRGAALSEGLALPAVLERCLGPQAARAIGFGGLRAGVLTLTVDSAALLGELSAFRGAELLSAVQARPEGKRVRSVRLVASGASEGADGRLIG